MEQNLSVATRRSPEDWQSILKTYESSGLSQKKFCEREGISKASFYKWRTKLLRQSKSSGFVELPSKPKNPKERAELRLELGDGIILHIHR
jgi:transposase-like protein